MIGETISHYRIVELLGAGGMGVVYKAEDSRLKRAVALKFLPFELTRDRDAKERLVHEAQAASALDHPNICTIHEIDETADGRLFLAMAYYDGETLKERLARGPLPVGEALGVAAQVARGVAAAHDAQIIHRDIKSANIILTRRGEVKLLDFGLAKLSGQTALTRTGTTVGTMAYMAPEQIAGVEADQRSDVWAIGVVLYEMLTGRLPFKGDNDAAVLNAILNATPRPVREERPEIPIEIERVVMRALEKEPKARFESARELLEHLPVATAAHTVTTIPATAPAPPPTLARPRVVVPIVVAVAASIAAGVWWVNSSRQTRLTRQTALPEMRRLIAQDNYVAAFGIASGAERVLGNDPELANLWPQLSVVYSVRTAPAGATVSVRDVALRSDWQALGKTPLDSVRVPAGMLRWKIEKAGFETSEFIGGTRGPFALAATIELTAADGTTPRDMIRIPAGALNLVLTGYDYNKQIPAGEYLIGRFEVTNKEFKEFVDRGGYENRQYWKHEFRQGGRTIPWEEGVARFRDQTGRPGPSTWEVGTYRQAQEDYPVAGVSWYEAAAYAEFRGRSLPTVYHWLRAGGTAFAASITPASNFGKNGLQPVGRSTAVSPYGLSDTAGNVKEWCWNEMEPGATRYILGAAWNEPDYQFLYPDARSPFDRSPTNGFRTAQYTKPDSLPAETTVAIERPTRNYSLEKPVSDDVFRALKTLYAYDPVPLAPAVEKVDDSSDVWRKEKVTFRAAYGNERVPAYLFLPKKAKAPFQTVLYWPPSSATRTRSSEPLPDEDIISFLLVSGRAVLYPIYFGTYERFDQRESTWPEATRAYREWVMKQVNDARRSLDYLETRPEIRHDGYGYLGYSWGSRMAPLVLAQEPRLHAAVLVSGGLSPGQASPETDPFNFAPRVSAPVLMVNGSQDFIFEVKLSQEPLYRTLGTAPDKKKHVVLEGGHGILLEKRAQVLREALDWFDRYLGAIQ
jgi:dienelactone hydrolase/tRNA A-37 threonylcarbamoyl transferase component Bud32